MSMVCKEESIVQITVYKLVSVIAKNKLLIKICIYKVP